jgi:MoaA/NifB/PqqE/SkfB family radical SAM enzyme
MYNLRKSIDAFALKQLAAFLESDPEKNIPRVLRWLKRFDPHSPYTPMYEKLEEYFADPANNWNALMKSIYTNIDTDVLKKLFENFVLNSGILGRRLRNEVSKKEDCNIPWAILMDPTSACNLHCLGCWAAQYGDRLSLDLETLDSIVRQGKELGTYVYLFSGGEPLLRKEDILELCARHDDCVFSAFTNGTLIDSKFADDMLRVKNFVPAISVEGFEEETDMRRGEGTYQAVLQAMSILKEKRLPFGFSACYHRKNTSVIGSETFFDDMIERGCLFGWLFTYMPVGKDAIPDLMVTAEQREFMYWKIREYRRTKPIFTLDFWNDGEYVEGCIAGGRRYLHINAAGDVEPCAFIHYASSNIKETTLLEALKSPIFQEYRRNQPFNSNHLRPCPLLDNPDRLASMVHKTHVVSTELVSPEDVDDLTAKCVSTAQAWAPVAQKLMDGTAERENNRD